MRKGKLKRRKKIRHNGKKEQNQIIKIHRVPLKRRVRRKE
jgi:hypothetical protein